MKKSIPLILIVFLAVGLGYWYWTTTPHFALHKVVQAVKEHDTKTFSYYVDMDSVSSNAINDLLSGPVKYSGGLSLLGKIVGVGLIGVFKPEMVKALNEQVYTYVEGPKADEAKTASENRIEEKPKKVVEKDSIDNAIQHFRKAVDILANVVHRPPLREVLKEMGFATGSYRGVAYVNTEKSEAKAGLKFFNSKLNEVMVLEVTMNNESGHWQVIHFSNLAELTAKLLKNTTVEGNTQE